MIAKYPISTWSKSKKLSKPQWKCLKLLCRLEKALKPVLWFEPAFSTTKCVPDQFCIHWLLTKPRSSSQMMSKPFKLSPIHPMQLDKVLMCGLWLQVCPFFCPVCLHHMYKAKENVAKGINVACGMSLEGKPLSFPFLITRHCSLCIISPCLKSKLNSPPLPYLQTGWNVLVWAKAVKLPLWHFFLYYLNRYFQIE